MSFDFIIFLKYYMYVWCCWQCIPSDGKDRVFDTPKDIGIVYCHAL